MHTVTGTIQVLGTKGTSFKLAERPDDWFSAFNGTQLGGASVGDKVGFTYIEKTKGDRTYLNINGNVSVKEPGVALTTSTSSGTQHTSLSTDKDIAIARAVALKAAVESHNRDDAWTPETILKTSKVYEDYLTGKLAQQEARLPKEELPHSSWEEGAESLRKAS
jgi:hypothetical protein